MGKIDRNNQNWYDRTDAGGIHLRATVQRPIPDGHCRFHAEKQRLKRKQKQKQTVRCIILPVSNWGDGRPVSRSRDKIGVPVLHMQGENASRRDKQRATSDERRLLPAWEHGRSTVQNRVRHALSQGNLDSLGTKDFDAVGDRPLGTILTNRGSRGFLGQFRPGPPACGDPLDPSARNL